jgi:hypothetical protein
MIRNVIEHYINVSLRTVRDLSLGPTLASRLLYLTSVIIYYSLSCFNYYQPTFIKEIPTISMGRLTPLKLESFLYESFKYLLEKMNYPLTHISLPNNIHWERSFEKCLVQVKRFIDGVDEDGWKQRNAGYVNNNGSSFIDVEGGVSQDLSTILSAPSEWVPLKHANASPQVYLTPNWGNVTPPANIPIEKYLQIADENYVSESRSDEIEELLKIYENMNDEKKMIAEYFQGGQVTPPGFWNVLAIYVLKSTSQNVLDFGRFYYLLNTGLFTAGIIAWNVKRKYLQPRPIQEIRMMRPPRLVTNYDGNTIDNRVWRAFQQSYFQAPPFPDYISGHSTFSSTAAAIFERFYPFFFNQTSIRPFTNEHCKMISVVIDNTYNSSVRCAMIKAGSSSIQSSDKTFPLGACRLDFSSWRQIAQLSGISRLYGGIHCTSANTVGLIIGEGLGTDILDGYSIPVPRRMFVE